MHSDGHRPSSEFLILYYVCWYCLQGHRGYALIFDIVCLQASYGQEMVQRHGEEYDWRSQPIDPQAAYASAGGQAHGRWDYLIWFSKLSSYACDSTEAWVTILSAWFTLVGWVFLILRLIPESWDAVDDNPHRRLHSRPVHDHPPMR